MDLDFIRIECKLLTDIEVDLIATLYNSLRTFELRFKESCCIHNIYQCLCSGCSERSSCPYQIVFNQGLSPDPEIVRIHQKPSLPFSLYIKELSADSLCNTVGIVVVGKAVNYIELFYTSLLAMIEKTVKDEFPFIDIKLQSYSYDYQDVPYVIGSAAGLAEDVILLSGQHVMQNTVFSDTITLTFLSPVRILSHGSILHRFDFSAFFRSQLRRCSSMCAYYGNGSLELDFADLSELSQNVTLFEDKTHYNQPIWSKRLNKAGLVGTVDCCGIVEPMLSLLVLASIFNAGKGATFGLGYHRIEVI